MDRSRRHFVPSSEGLEGRQMLSTAAHPVAAARSAFVNPFGSAPPGTQVDGSSPVAQTIEIKRRRIENLPFFLGKLHRDGALPQPAAENIQRDLNSFVGTLHEGDHAAVSAFNLDIRRAQPYESIRPVDAANLDRDFGNVLVSAGVRPEVAADLQSQMKQLVQFDTTQPTPRIVATNDYAIVLEVALGSGRPLAFPTVPNLLGSDHNGNVGKIPVTHNSQPTLTGNYVPGTNIQIVDVNNQVVLGTSTVDPTTNIFKARFNGRLPDGIYTVRIRAEDSGFVSEPSPKFTFEVKTSGGRR